ncbi:hypothetical protein [Streptomyces sp. 8K308]|nr:hypothetical protein [Streptomyces sp. 8K308]
MNVDMASACTEGTVFFRQGMTPEDTTASVSEPTWVGSGSSTPRGPPW